MEGGDIPCWDQLIPDVLWLVFIKLSLEEKLTVISRICKSWRKAVMSPYCWQEIEIENKCYSRAPKLLDRMLRMLIRCAGSPRKLCVVGLPNDNIFSFIADHACSLQTLQIQGSKISNSIVEQVAGQMCAITLLDLSYCDEIGSPALEAFGKNCRFLSSLKRNKHSPTLHHNWRFHFKDDEAHAIASTMPNLNHLEIAYASITTRGVLDILSGCPKLVFLDLTGYWDVLLDKKFLNEKCSGLEVVTNNYNFYSDSDDSDLEVPMTLNKFSHADWDDDWLYEQSYEGSRSDDCWFYDPRDGGAFSD